MTIEIYVKLPDSTLLHIPNREVNVSVADPHNGALFLPFDAIEPLRAESGVVTFSQSQITINQTGAFTLRATAVHPVSDTSPGLLTIRVELPVVEYGGRPLKVTCNVRSAREPRTGVTEIQGRKFQSQYSYDLVQV